MEKLIDEVDVLKSRIEMLQKKIKNEEYFLHHPLVQIFDELDIFQSDDICKICIDYTDWMFCQCHKTLYRDHCMKCIMSGYGQFQFILTEDVKTTIQKDLASSTWYLDSYACLYGEDINILERIKAIHIRGGRYKHIMDDVTIYVQCFRLKEMPISSDGFVFYPKDSILKVKPDGEYTSFDLWPATVA